MKKILLFIVAGVVYSVIGECVESEFSVPISRNACRDDKNMVTNIIFDVLSEDGKSILVLTPNVQSCIKYAENGAVHFVDLDCGIHLRRITLSNGMESLKKYWFTMVKAWRIIDKQKKEIDYCGGGRMSFGVDDVFRSLADATQKKQGITALEWCAMKRKDRCFLSSGMHRLLAYGEDGKLRTYFKNAFNADKWFVVTYVLWVEKGNNTEVRKLWFTYNIARVYENKISPMQKGELSILTKDRSVCHADGIKAIMTKSAEWNYSLDVEFESMGCQIRILQHDINDAISAWDVE